MYYARVVFKTNESAAARLDDEHAARGWIEAERYARPALFRLGQVFEGPPDWQVIATRDRKGWQSGPDARP